MGPNLSALAPQKKVLQLYNPRESVTIKLQAQVLYKGQPGRVMGKKDQGHTKKKKKKGMVEILIEIKSSIQTQSGSCEG